MLITKDDTNNDCVSFNTPSMEKARQSTPLMEKVRQRSTNKCACFIKSELSRLYTQEELESSRIAGGKRKYKTDFIDRLTEDNFCKCKKKK